MSTCDARSGFEDLEMGARIASVFVMLAVSAVGAFLPLLAAKWKFLNIPPMVLQLTKHFGTGVILATAFIHLLGEAQENLTDPCLGEGWETYPWASGLCLIGTFAMFTIELFVQQIVVQKHEKICETLCNNDGSVNDRPDDTYESYYDRNAEGDREPLEPTRKSSFPESLVNPSDRGNNCGSIKNFRCHEVSLVGPNDEKTQDVLQKITSIFLLEFGIVFHSVFVGLSLAIAGDEFKTLFVAISFHQFFEGIGLGSRFATTSWPVKLRMVPWIFSLLYSLTTPIGVAAGLGVRHYYLDSSSRTLIVVGVFDSFCAGLLIYNCLVELMAPDFLVEMRHSSLKKVFLSYFMLVLGTFGMALLGKWA